MCSVSPSTEGSREISVIKTIMQGCPPEVRASIVEFSFPQDNAIVGKPFGPFYARAHIEYNSKKYNPSIAFFYTDGPADSIIVIDEKGKRWDLTKKGGIVIKYPINTGECNYMTIPGWYVIFPAAGTYQIQILSGYTTDGTLCYSDSRLAIVNAVSEQQPPQPSPTPWLPIPTWVLIAIGAFFLMMIIGLILLAVK